jgi:hypothetical protein
VQQSPLAYPVLMEKVHQKFEQLLADKAYDSDAVPNDIDGRVKSGQVGYDQKVLTTNLTVNRRSED